MTATKNFWLGSIALGGILLFLCLATSPASADEVEDRIRALEEVQRANAAELEKLKGEQVELRKEATAAAAKLPDFTYRPGNGLNIEAADKSWGFRASLQSQFRLGFLSAKTRSDGLKAKSWRGAFDRVLSIA